MRQDIRNSLEYLAAESLFERFWQPGTGRIVDATELDTVSESLHAVFAGTIVDTLEGAPPTRICSIHLETGATRVLTFGPNTDRTPKVSPDGRLVAFRSDRRKAGDFQLYLLDPESGAARSTPVVDGWIEFLHWSPDGQRILLGVAGYGADVSSAQGAISSTRDESKLPQWMPQVEGGDEDFQWRSAWCYDLATDTVRPITPAGLNIWEAQWCGSSSIIAVASPAPGEGFWYTATLQIVDVDSGAPRALYKPHDQLGWPSASPDGKWVAVVEAVCSDRWVVNGDLRVIEVATGSIRNLDTHEVDVSHTQWCSEHELLVAGMRGFETVVGLYDVCADTFTERWCSKEPSTGGHSPKVAGWGAPGDCALIGEGFFTAPEIATVCGGAYRTVHSFDVGYRELVSETARVDAITWRAPDGLEIQGWLLRPMGAAPYPLVMMVHGGPVAHYRPSYLMRNRPLILMLLQRGYAVFLPNPRGSSGRGQAFARLVFGDMGGADTFDYLSGLDHLVATGVADPKRLGVTGGSYGGYMSAWLITQDSRFSAAVVVSPMTNLTTEHLISNIPHFVQMFMNDHYRHASGKYFERSPIMHAHRVETPTLNICGALDRCTPPEEAVQFHNALLENDVKSMLLTYPQEGHGVRKLPAAVDCTARTIAWFDEHLRHSSKAGV